ncbi:hypothetical protein OEZ86_008411 [Tetradesmus obliquus]|nr:hypothetical protein OEZ86_008411 [Tetradesmus obliquus]
MAAVDESSGGASMEEHEMQHEYEEEQHELSDSMGGSAAGRQQPLLLVTTVDIGEGRSDRIEVRLGDVPMDVAREFVIKHGLPPAIIPRLAVHLEDNLAKVAAQKAAAAHARGKMGGSQCSEDELAVFHRLYEQAIALRSKLDQKRDAVKQEEIESIQANKTAMSWISSEMMRDRSSGPFENYGEMLYAESLEAMQRKREKEERRKAEKQIQEVAGATFKPEISRLAQNLWSPHECTTAPAWQRLSKVKMTKAQERLEMLRREKEADEVKECTFKPQLNNRSERLMTERSQTLRSLNVSAHQQLYQDAVRRQQKMQDYQHWYPEEVTFQPKLHESAMSREFLRKSLGPEGAAMLAASGEERHMALVNRLYASYEKLQNKLSEARSTLTAAVDPATGKKLFHPETGRAPNFARGNAKAGGVGEYLYNLKQQQDDKARAVKEEMERKRVEDAQGNKQSASSKHMVKALQNKRFRQIFDFLDQDCLGSFNLVALMASTPEWLDDLDDEVRADLEMAGKLLAKRSQQALKHNDSGKSEASIFMPPPPSAEDMGEGGEGSTPGTPSGQPGLVSLRQFCELMEEVLATRRGPRAYLAPSPPRKYVPSETYKPQIDERSKQLAAKIRPKDTPLYEVLYQEGSALNQRKNERRVRAEAEMLSTCTFAPKLTSQQLVKSGRVMQGVRDGTWYHKSNAGELDSADSLQQLAALMDEPAPPVQDAWQQEEREAAEAAAAAASTPPRSPVGVSAAAQQLQELQLREAAGDECSPVFKQDSLRSRFSRPSSRQASARLREEAELQAAAAAAVAAGQQASAAAIATGRAAAEAAAAEDESAGEEDESVDEYEGSEEQRQYLELEREVQQMLAATSAAAEAAAHMQSASDQQYLSEILGLAQEQVDAMAPAISHLKGMEPHSSKHSRSPSSMYAESAAASAAASSNGQAGSSSAAAAAVRAAYAPQSSFKVSMAALREEEQPQQGPAAAASAVASAAASASPSTSPSKQPSMQRGQLQASPGRQSPSQQSPGALSRKGSQSMSRQASSKAPAAAAAAAAGGLIGSRASSKQLMEELDLFELAAGLGGSSSRKLGM